MSCQMGQVSPILERFLIFVATFLSGRLSYRFERPGP